MLPTDLLYDKAGMSHGFGNCVVHLGIGKGRKKKLHVMIRWKIRGG